MLIISQQGMTVGSLQRKGVNDFLIPDKKWSDKNGKEFDVEEPDA